MRILLVEDDPKNIESAKAQFQGHDLVIADSYASFEELESTSFYGDKKVDLVLTDLYIPIGEYTRYTSCGLTRLTNPTDLYPIGLMVVILAQKTETLCFLITNSNGHEDAWGFMLENVGFGSDNMSLASWDREEGDKIRKLFIVTRPCLLDNGAKDWFCMLQGITMDYFPTYYDDKTLEDELWEKNCPSSKYFEVLGRWTKL